MTKEAIHLCLKRKQLRDNPKEVKDSLYLNNRGFSEIRNLEPFTEVRVLHLESNKLTRINNLEALKRLQTLCLQKNKIANIEKLHRCKELKFLDISKNDISRIDNLSSVKKLETLIISQNNLTKVDSIEHLPRIPRLRELDLGSNKIDCPPEGILKILSNCKSLRVLTLAKNPFVKKMPHYRKMVLITCPELKCLDGRVVCKEERRRCKAWGKVILNGGTFAEAQDADREELMRIRREMSIKNNMKRRGCDEEYYPQLSSSIIQSLMKTLGINETRRSISMISWTHTSRDVLSDDEDQFSNDGLEQHFISTSKPSRRARKSLNSSWSSGQIAQKIQNMKTTGKAFDDDFVSMSALFPPPPPPRVVD